MTSPRKIQRDLSFVRTSRLAQKTRRFAVIEGAPRFFANFFAASRRVFEESRNLPRAGPSLVRHGTESRL